ncbi:hypothetical protein BDW74DRAFT_102301 [Aspergillus multicolor]|uniref:uncharacterized protein n=1 Tax=Aspergillus multicolor TaxID=41759 RepID=UPI003CCD0308
MPATTAEDIRAGKHDPEGYCKAKESFPTDRATGAEVWVVEDAPAGILAGKAARCKVLAVATTHSVPELKSSGADWVVRDLRSVRLELTGTSSDVVLVLSGLL